jgi:hypothetical protein
MSDLGSGQTTLETLFTNRAFRVPPYQRHYAWEERQIRDLIDDISNVSDEKPYFFGTLLFMRPTGESQLAPELRRTSASGPYKVFEVVDGQQRLTTAVLFINAVHREKPMLLRPMHIRNFLIDNEEGVVKFQTVPDDWPFLRALLEPTSEVPPVQTPSQGRLKKANEFFRSMAATHDNTQVEKWIRILCGSLVLVHTVSGYDEACMIFETVNDRGKRLTDLEGLKSFLMHVVGVTAKSPLQENQAIDVLQRNFSEIYRMINRFESYMPEDDALRQCYFVFSRMHADGTRKHWYGEGTAKDDVKSWLTELVRGGYKEPALAACHALAQLIQTSFQKMEAVINNTRRWEEIDRLLVLRRMAAFWPILLTAYADGAPAEEEAFQCVLRLCEVASLKIWGISDYNSNKAVSALIGIAQQEGSQRDKAIARIKDLLKWWDIPNRWRDGLYSNSFYYQGRDARYVLFEYENHLRSKKGYPRIPYSDFDQMTIEHIAARRGEENVTKCLLDLSQDSRHAVTRDEAGAESTTGGNLLHHLGNLVIDPQPTNSAKNNLPVTGKLKWFKTAPYLSQIEIEDYLVANNEVWDASVILRRGIALAEFAMNRWNEDEIALPVAV